MALPELQDNIGSPAGAEAPESLGSVHEGLRGGATEFGLALPKLQNNIGVGILPGIFSPNRVDF